MSFRLLIGFAVLCAAAGVAILAEEAAARRRARRDDIEAIVSATREPGGWCTCAGCTTALDRLISDLREWDQEMNTP